MHKRDADLLYKIKEFFLVGTIISDRQAYVVYTVRSLKDLNDVIVPFFEKHFLITQKRSDFELFKEIVSIKANNRHLSLENFNRILSLRANLNNGWSEKLQKAFPNIVPVDRPLFTIQEIPNPWWLAGFIDGEGCFIINIQESISSVDGSINYKVWLTFYITQHVRDAILMGSIVKYLDCGQLVKKSNQMAVDFKVGKLENILSKVIPFLQKYPLQSAKFRDFKDWVEASVLIRDKEHFTENGINKLKSIKNGMNKKREQ